MSSVPPTSDDRPVTLVTGPTSGIGRSFARRLAADGYDLVLCARDAERLKALAQEVADAQGTRSEILVVDLATPEGRATVADRLAAGVDVLVNNAGGMSNGTFWEQDLAVLERQIDLNVTAVMALTHAALPAMVRAGSGSIINVASIAAFFPGRGGPYAGTKSYVSGFTQALASELHGTGVRIQALCPGFVDTEFHERGGASTDAVPPKAILNPDDVVTASLNDLERGAVVSIPNTRYKILVMSGKLLPPALTNWVWGRLF